MASAKIEKAQARLLKRKVQELKALQLVDGGMAPRATVEYAATVMRISERLYNSITDEQLEWLWR
jgi:hypothetical protein